MNLGLKSMFMVLLLSLVVSGCILVNDSEAKVGYIDLQRLVAESKLGQEALEALQRMRQEKEKEVFEKLQQVNLMKSEIDTQRYQMSAETLREKVNALQKANKEYQRMVADAKEDIAREEREMVADILRKADPVLKQVAKKRKYKIILKDPNAVAYLEESVDITDEVINKLNAMK
jgi:outer membrane protein